MRIFKIKEENIAAFWSNVMVQQSSNTALGASMEDNFSHRSIRETGDNIPVRENCVINGNKILSVGDKVSIIQTDYGKISNVKLEITNIFEIVEYDDYSNMAVRIQRSCEIVE